MVQAQGSEGRWAQGKTFATAARDSAHQEIYLAELVTLLKGKMGQPTQGMKVNELKSAWEMAKVQDPPEDIILLEQPQPPTFPAVNQTALGWTIKRKFNEVVAAVDTTADAIDPDGFNEIVTQFHKICARHGVTFANTTTAKQV